MGTVRIKDHFAEQRLFESRAIVAAIVLMLAVGAILSRLFFLQVVQYDYFVALSAGNRIRVEPVPPNRGLILDRNGLPFATNRPSYQLELVREQIENIDDTLARLVEIGLIEKEQIAILKRDIRGRRSFDAVPIKLQLTDGSEFAVTVDDAATGAALLADLLASEGVSGSPPACPACARSPTSGRCPGARPS